MGTEVCSILFIIFKRLWILLVKASYGLYSRKFYGILDKYENALKYSFSSDRICRMQVMDLLRGPKMDKKRRKTMPSNTFDLDRDKLTYYIGVRNMTQTELAKKSGISRTTINQYCCGTAKPTKETMYKLAGALGVQFSDLSLSGEVADAGEKINELVKLLNSCLPSTLKRNFPFVKELLTYSHESESELLDFLLLKANSLGAGMLIRFYSALKALPQAYRGYESPIAVYYAKSEEGPWEYSCLVKFEPWVYEFFGFEDDSQFHEVVLEAEPGTPEFYTDMTDELQTDLSYEIGGALKGPLADAFSELLDNGNWREPQEIIFEDYDPLQEIKTELKAVRLKKLFERLLAEGMGPEILARAAADEAYAARLFEEYGIEM